MKYKKREQRPAYHQQARQPLYHHGMRTDDPNYVRNPVVGAGKKSGKRPPMDPRYPPARYAGSENYAYKGPTVRLPSHRQEAPLLEQPKVRPPLCQLWPYWWLWLIVASVIVGFCLGILMVILYVFGELTKESPVYKGYFG